MELRSNRAVLIASVLSFLSASGEFGSPEAGVSSSRERLASAAANVPHAVSQAVAGDTLAPHAVRRTALLSGASVGASVGGGDLGELGAGGAPEIVVASKATATPPARLIAPSVWLGRQAAASDVLANAVVDRASAHGEVEAIPGQRVERAPRASRQETALQVKESEVALGRALFFDKRMSADGKVACVTCHRPERAFAGALPTPIGVFGRRLTRNPPSLADAARPKALCWDGRGAGLEAIAFGAYLDPAEFGNEKADEVFALVAKNHAEAYQRAFPGAAVSSEKIGRALASFVRTLRVEDSPFDRYLAGDQGALTDAQKRGFRLFTGAAECSRCHLVEASRATFSDEKFHWGDISVDLKPRLGQLAAQMAQLDEKARIAAMVSRGEVAALGRFLITLRPEDVGLFLTPSLRNVALTAPYMHDGSVETLREAVEREVYYRRARENTTLGKLTPEERKDLTAFLESLTSRTMEARRLATEDERTRP